MGTIKSKSIFKPHKDSFNYNDGYWHSYGTLQPVKCKCSISKENRYYQGKIMAKKCEKCKKYRKPYTGKYIGEDKAQENFIKSLNNKS